MEDDEALTMKVAGLHATVTMTARQRSLVVAAAIVWPGLS